MANNANLSRRAALRQQQEMEQQQKRRNRILGIGAAIVVVAVLVVIAVVAIPPILRGNKTEVTENQLTPPNATEQHGILYKGIKPKKGVPHLTIYSDFRCPACKANEDAYGDIYRQLADEGKITVEFHTTYFLDDHGGDSSERAAVAADAADAVGKYAEYKKAVFANQKSEYTDKELSEDFAQQAGITGENLTKFQELYRTRAYQDFAAKAHEDFINSPIGSTPTYRVKDERLVFADEAGEQVFIQPTPEALLDAITKADKGEKANSHAAIKE